MATGAAMRWGLELEGEKPEKQAQETFRQLKAENDQAHRRHLLAEILAWRTQQTILGFLAS